MSTGKPRCPKCGKGKLQTTNTRCVQSAANYAVRRRLVCSSKKCGHRIWTLEVVVEASGHHQDGGFLISTIQRRRLEGVVETLQKILTNDTEAP